MVILVIYLQLYGLVDGGRMAIVPGVLIVSFPSGSNSGDSRGNQTPARAAPGESSTCTQAYNRKWCRECSVLTNTCFRPQGSRTYIVGILLVS